MAHIGQHYELAFRRDYSLNQETYRFGWPKAFKSVRQWTNGHSVFSSVQPDNWFSLPVDDSVQGVLTYDWPEFVDGTNHCTMRYTMLKPFQPGSNPFATIENFVNGTLIWKAVRNDYRNTGYGTQGLEFIWSRTFSIASLYGYFDADKQLITARTWEDH